MKNRHSTALRGRWILVPLLAVVAFFTFRPVPILPADECAVAVGRITSIEEGSSHDVVFRLAGDDRIYYINRGLEQGLSLDALRSELLGRDVTLSYPEHWSLFGFVGAVVGAAGSHHVSKLETVERVVFDETR